MEKRYYFDTSIWLDLFEDRDEPNLPKGKWAHELVEKIIKDNDIILYSDNNLIELNILGYSEYDLEKIFKPLKQILFFVEATEKQIGLARDLSAKRNIPRRDALHAIIARDNRAVFVTLDHHFQQILDIEKPRRPQDII